LSSHHVFAAAAAQEQGGAHQPGQCQQIARFGHGGDIAQGDEMTVIELGGEVIAGATGIIADRPLVAITVGECLAIG
jgi:hypothetical protein